MSELASDWDGESDSGEDSGSASDDSEGTEDTDKLAKMIPGERGIKNYSRVLAVKLKKKIY